MCLVIDAMTLPLVFKSKSGNKSGFYPVLAWVNGKGRMVYGGTKYNKELVATGCLGIVAELGRKRKTIRIANDTADGIAAALKEKIPDEEFNDEHIMALVIASRCCVVCTHDKKAMRFLKRKDILGDYDGVQRPKIFTGHKDHKKLCCDNHVVGLCKDGG
jgi:hypothetical protein